MSEFVTKGLIIVFGFIPLGVGAAILTAGLCIGAAQTARERELKAQQVGE